MSKLISAITFILTHGPTIWKLISELLALFGNDKAKVEECLNGLCNAATKLPPAPKVEKPKGRLLGLILSRIGKK
jgi:hypothetical protein